ncbi:MAG: tRNA (guanosine(46)-N7)-methyltransferase TrmB, partial [Pseudomonadales bacterium]
LVQPEFVALLCKKLAPGGLLHIATDWQPYADYCLSVLDRSEFLQNCAGKRNFADNSGSQRPLTRFEQRGIKLGHAVWELKFLRR